MSAEEFTDTVFAKIDINGDGEGAEEGFPGGGVSREAVAPGGGQERRRTQGLLLVVSSAHLCSGCRPGFGGSPLGSGSFTITPALALPLPFASSSEPWTPETSSCESFSPSQGNCLWRNSWKVFRRTRCSWTR